MPFVVIFTALSGGEIVSFFSCGVHIKVMLILPQSLLPAIL